MLPKSNRLNKGYKKILLSGLKLRNNYYLLIYLPNNSDSLSLGFIVSKKHGKAYRRNKIRRIFKSLVREYLINSKIEKGFDIIVIPSNRIVDWKISNILKKELFNDLNKIICS